MNMINYEEKSDLFQMLSHPVRLQILDELRRREACVCHLQAVTGRPQAYISQQLRFLREAGLVNDVKDGQNVFYQLTHEKTRIILKGVLGEPDAPSTPPTCTCPYCTGDRT